MRLTAEQIETIQACGSKVLPVAGEAFHVLSQQNRIFEAGGERVVVRRPSGFLETRGTLELLLTQHADALRALPMMAESAPPSELRVGTRVSANGAAPGDVPAELARRRPERPATVPLPSDPEAASAATAEDAFGRTAVPSEALTEVRTEYPVSPAPLPALRLANEGPAREPSDIPAEAGLMEAGLMEPGQPLPDRARAAQPTSSSATRPAVPIEDSIQPDHLICLEDGRKLKMLTRHLRTAYAMSPEQYRARWSLPPDYPMVAPDTAERRVLIAKQPRPGAKARAELKQGAET